MSVSVHESQRDQALVRANEVRSGVARLRREIAELSYIDGCLRVVDLLEHPVKFSDSARIGWLLRSVRSAGPAKVAAWLRYASVRSWERPIRDLSPRQCEVLAEVLRRAAAQRLRERSRS